MSFVHLHTHSHYSLLDGLSKIDGLVERAAAYKMPAMALTDHGAMYGAIEFYQKARAKSIKPILGVEAYIAPRTLADKEPRIDSKPYHLTVLAKNAEGYKNLSKLVSVSHLEGFYYKPRMDKEILKTHAEGLIILTGCLNSELSKTILSNKTDNAHTLIEYYLDTFGKENVFLEIQSHPALKDQLTVNEVLEKLAKKYSLPLVATGDSHYLSHDDQAAHEVLLAVSTGKDVDDSDRLTLNDVDLSVSTPEEMLTRFAGWEQAVENTLRVAESVNLELKIGEHILPKFPLPKGQKSAQKHLEELAIRGLKHRYGKNSEAEKRLKYELSVVEDMGFADYFLIVADFINWAKDQGIVVGPGRGSAAGAITSYALNVTNLDPLQHGLLFERFLNPGRKEMPDIDIDFADDRRDEVLGYVQQKYGEERVAQIITFGTMAARGSVRDVARALGKNYAFGDQIAKLIPGKPGTHLKDSLENVKELKALYDDDPEVKKVYDTAMKLEGVVRHASTHACGVIIADRDLTEYLPLAANQKGPMRSLTQFSMNDCAAIGLLKMDFLGLSNLTIIKNCLRIIRKRHNKEVDVDKIPLDDKKTYDLLSRAETVGVFQLESEGMRRYLKEIKPSEFEDITAMVSLYRPGPIELIPDFIAAKHGRKQVTYLHPKLEPILQPTYGIGIYQEQMMRIATDLAGYSLPEADTLRKAIGKKIKELLDEQHEKLVAGMVKNDIEKEIAEEIWELFPPFARYGFNKSHAASYALIAYQTAYLKAHYTAEFMAALLTSDIHNLDRISIEISEAERLGLKILPPSVNHSFGEFGVTGDGSEIRYGLSAIKNIGEAVSEKIVEERKAHEEFQSLEDFITRLDSSVVNKKAIESLAMCGALDDLAERQQILDGIDAILKFFTDYQKQKNSSQIDLFGQVADTTLDRHLELPPTTPASKQQRLAWEKELLSFYISEHPLDEFKEKLSKLNSISEITGAEVDQQIEIGGILTHVKTINTRNGDNMAFVTIEDFTSSIELVVFPRTYTENVDLWQAEKMVVVKGKINDRDGERKILADRVTELASAKVKKHKDIKQVVAPKSSLKVLLNDANKNKLKSLKELLEKYPGDVVVSLGLENNPGKTWPTSLKVNADDQLLNQLEELIGKSRVKVE